MKKSVPVFFVFLSVFLFWKPLSAGSTEEDYQNMDIKKLERLTIQADKEVDRLGNQVYASKYSCQKLNEAPEKFQSLCKQLSEASVKAERLGEKLYERREQEEQAALAAQ